MSEIGIGIFLVGVSWLIVLSLKNPATLVKKVLWTAANLFFNPAAGIAFYVQYGFGLMPMTLCLIGFLLILIGGISLK